MIYPRFRPGPQPPVSATAMNRMASAAERAVGNIAEAGGMAQLDLPGGRVNYPGPERELWIRITGSPPGTTDGDFCAYDWEMVLKDDNDLVSYVNQQSGIVSNFPAWEMQGITTVPYGTIVRARVGESAQLPGMEFRYEGVSGSGGVFAYKTECVNGLNVRYISHIYIEDGELRQSAWEMDSLEGCCECSGSAGGCTAAKECFACDQTKKFTFTIPANTLSEGMNPSCNCPTHLEMTWELCADWPGETSPDIFACTWSGTYTDGVMQLSATLRYSEAESLYELVIGGPGCDSCGGEACYRIACENWDNCGPNEMYLYRQGCAGAECCDDYPLTITLTPDDCGCADCTSPYYYSVLDPVLTNGTCTNCADTVWPVTLNYFTNIYDPDCGCCTWVGVVECTGCEAATCGVGASLPGSVLLCYDGTNWNLWFNYDSLDGSSVAHYQLDGASWVCDGSNVMDHVSDDGGCVWPATITVEALPCP